MTTITGPRSRRAAWRVTATLLALTVAATGCARGAPADRDDRVTLGPITPLAALETFDSCDALLDHLQAEALDRVGPYGLEDALPYPPIEDLALAEDVAAPAARGGDAEATGEVAPEPGAPGVSGTNVQEEGVDEPDLVKADEQRMVVVTEDELVVVDLQGPEPSVSGRLTLAGGYAHELLVAGDRALVLTGDGGEWSEPRFDGVAPAGIPTATLTEVDLSDPAAPSLVRSLDVEGAYVSARMQGAVARIVVSGPGPDLGFVYPADPTEAGERRAEEVNRAVIEDSSLDDWLPGWSMLDGDDGNEADGHLDDCDAVHRPADFAGFGLVSVLTVDLETGLDSPEAVSVLGAGDTVYASPDRLYVATERLEERDEADPDEPTAAPSAPSDEAIPDIAPPPIDVRTTVHRFAAPASGPVAYEASGEVEGRLLNQFSLSEHEDVLRVATTRGEPWLDGGSDSLVTTLGRDGDRLVELGRVEDLGRGEEIFAVRFVGPVGYVVTFRQTDPLYVVDLRDPTAPTVDGELKILGYSAYLHPIDETHVLGVGQDADDQGRTSGTQVSLFDVSDPAAPVRTAQVTVPGGNSEVEWDHRAFLWWAPTGTAVVPLERYGDLDAYESGALVIDVDAGNGVLGERGQVDHGSSPVRRSVVVDDVLVTLDGSGLVFTGLDDLVRRGEVRL